MKLSTLDHFGPIKKQFHLSPPSVFPLCAEFFTDILKGNVAGTSCLLRILKPSWMEADVSNQGRPFDPCVEENLRSNTEPFLFPATCDPHNGLLCRLHGCFQFDLWALSGDMKCEPLINIMNLGLYLTGFGDDR